jgi:hypothetical protein
MRRTDLEQSRSPSKLGRCQHHDTARLRAGALVLQVTVRVRPLNKREIGLGAKTVTQVYLALLCYSLAQAVHVHRVAQVRGDHEIAVYAPEASNGKATTVDTAAAKEDGRAAAVNANHLKTVGVVAAAAVAFKHGLNRPKSRMHSRQNSMDHEPTHTFTFDRIYDSSGDPDDVDYATQERIFADLGKGVIDNAATGYNATIFAYGQTGAGKSYCMMGMQDGKSEPGIIPRVCHALFDRKKQVGPPLRTLCPPC